MPQSSFLRRIFYVVFAVVLGCALSAPFSPLFAVCNNNPTLNTPQYTIPNFGQNPDVISVNNGDWSASGTWSTGNVPTANDVVCIDSQVTLNVTNAVAHTVAIQAGALLSFRPDVQTQLQVDNLLVLQGGELQIGTPTNPIEDIPGDPDNVTAKVVIVDRPVNTTRDPEQFGHGLVVLGKVTLHGAIKSFAVDARLAQNALQGHTAVTLKQAVSGWLVGDRLTFPDTRFLGNNEKWSNYVPQWEEVTVRGFSNGNRTLHFNPEQLSYDHTGSYDGFLMPHVANLTRNVVIQSANPSSRTNRGIAFFTDTADVDIRYVAFIDLGRTTWDAYDNFSNHSDRNALTLRQMQGPTFIGNAVYNTILNPYPSFLWGFSLVDVGGAGNFTGNTVYNWGGSAIRITGESRLNVIEKNFLMGVQGPRDVRDGTGRHGNGISGNGPVLDNYYRENVAASMQSRVQQIVAGAGYNFGHVHGSGYSMVPIREFSGNEAYGAMATGMTLWHIGTDGYGIRSPNPMGTIKDFKVYHARDEAFFGYPIEKITFDGFVYRGDPSVDRGHLFGCGDYQCGDITILNADVRGASRGIDPGGGVSHGSSYPGVFTIRDSYFEVKDAAIVIRTQQTAGTGAQVYDSEFRIENCLFVPYNGSSNFEAIFMNFAIPSNPSGKENVPVRAFVTNFNRQPGQDFQIYFREQAVPGTQAAGGPAPCASTGECAQWEQNALTWMNSIGLVNRPMVRDTVAPASPRNFRIR